MTGLVARGFAGVSAGLDRCCCVLSIAAAFVMLGSVMLQIVARYVFDAPPAWTEELARYAMIWSAMPGAAMAYFRREDPVLIRVKADSTPRRAATLAFIEWLAVLTFCAPVFWFTPGFLHRHAGRITETLELNSAVVVCIIPICLAIIAIHSTTRLTTALDRVWARA